MSVEYNELLQQIATLKERILGLGTRLAQAAVELKEAGVPIDERLMDAISAYRRDFASTRSRLLELAQSSKASGLPAPAQVTSIKDLEGIARAIAPSQSTPVDESKDKALEVLDRVLSISHTQESAFPPLQAAHAKARELRSRIASATASSLPPDVGALGSGKHPFSALLMLIDEKADVEDNEWGVLVEVVARAFGKPLTVAASRGKLQCAIGGASPSATTAKTTPEMVVIGGSGAPTEAQSRADREVLQPQGPPSKESDVIILPSFEQAQQGTQGDRLTVGSAAPAAPTAEGSDSALGLKIMVHLERFGDREFRDREFAGTRGQALRLEGFAIAIEPPHPGLGIRYMAHVQNLGDTPWVTEGEYIGSRGQGNKLEGFAIELTGPEAQRYKVCYMAHIERVGDTEVFSDGEFCGRRGKALRVEGIKVWVQEK
jgi:hypothetical protein